MHRIDEKNAMFYIAAGVVNHTQIESNGRRQPNDESFITIPIPLVEPSQIDPAIILTPTHLCNVMRKSVDDIEKRCNLHKAALMNAFVNRSKYDI